MEEMIELRQIVNTLLKGKWIIGVCTIAALLCAAIVNWFVLDESYTSTATVKVMNSIKNEEILYQHLANEFKPAIYMKYAQKSGMAATNAPDSNIVELSFTASSAKEAQEKLQLQLEDTKLKLDTSIKDSLQELEQTYAGEVENLSTEIEQLMTKYNNIILENQLPEILIFQTLASEQFEVSLTQDQLKSLGNMTGAIQNELYQLTTQIKVKSEEYQSNLTKYESIKSGLDSFNSAPFIRTIVEPSLNESPVSPNTKMNLVVGLVLGFMVGIGLVLMRWYWKSSSVNN